VIMIIVGMSEGMLMSMEKWTGRGPEACGATVVAIQDDTSHFANTAAMQRPGN
jgi:hypothetical protein